MWSIRFHVNLNVHCWKIVDWNSRFYVYHNVVAWRIIIVCSIQTQFTVHSQVSTSLGCGANSVENKWIIRLNFGTFSRTIWCCSMIKVEIIWLTFWKRISLSTKFDVENDYKWMKTRFSELLSLSFTLINEFFASLVFRWLFSEFNWKWNEKNLSRKEFTQ